MTSINIFEAARLGDEASVLKCITQDGVSVDETDKHRRTALHLASWSGKHTVVKLLISLG
jgi:ankyrin repeat protein